MKIVEETLKDYLVRRLKPVAVRGEAMDRALDTLNYAVDAGDNRLANVAAALILRRCSGDAEKRIEDFGLDFAQPINEGKLMCEIKGYLKERGYKPAIWGGETSLKRSEVYARGDERVAFLVTLNDIGTLCNISLVSRN